jgi:hypothetical protein
MQHTDEMWGREGRVEEKYRDERSEKYRERGGERERVQRGRER